MGIIYHKGVPYASGTINEETPYGTSAPSGGSDGDLYIQIDNNGNIVKVWQNHNNTWGYLSGGGSEVIPNPQDEPTDILNTVEINGTVYDVEGGGGSNLIIDAQKYSLEEQVVGIWTDGKPLYQKTWELSSVLSVASNTWVDTSILKQGIDNIIYINGANAEGAVFSFLGARAQTSTSNYVQIQQTRNSAITLKYITIQYTKTADIAGSGGYQAFGFTPIVCSDTEREVGVWEDNKPLYQKTFIGTLGGTAGGDVSNYKMADLSDIDTIVSISGTLQGITPINSYYASDNYNMVFVNGTKNGLYCNGKNIGGNTYKVTIQYTKASDVAGSGEYNTLAIPNVHYSTDEQVIGTWIDGKTLYQKTFEVATTTKGDWVVIINDASILIKEYEGKTCFANGNRINVDHFIDTSNYGTGLILNNGHQFQAIVYNTVNNMEKYIITLKYTKTTDV